MQELIKKPKIIKFFLITLFLLSLIITFSINNTHYNSTKAPDFNFYSNYISYFFGSSESPGIEQGLIYFFLVSISIKLGNLDFGLNNYEQIVSNGILITNYFLYSIGLFGLYKLLKYKKFSTNNILFTFTVLSFFPQTINMLLTMKPEIIAFSIIPWSLYLIENYLEKDETIYLYLALFPNLILLTTKGTIVATVGLIYLYLFIVNKKFLNNKKFYGFLIITSIFLFALLFENLYINGKNILEHSPQGYNYRYRASLSFLFNINLKELFITNPFRHNHADSLIGIILLDTFGDYFQNYALEDKNLFAYSRKEIPRLYFMSYWTQFISILLTAIFYIASVLHIKVDKQNSLYYSLPFFGLGILILLAYGFPFLSFDPNKADTFKTHYYSYLLVISMGFIIVSVITKFSKAKLVIFIIMFSTFFNLYGFNKIDTNGYSNLINIVNNSASSCKLNSYFLNDFEKENCDSIAIKVCKISSHINDGHYLTTKNVDNVDFRYYYPQQELRKDSSVVTPRNSYECINYINEMYRYKSYLHNPIRIPYVNLSFYLLSLSAIIYTVIKEKREQA